uniref:Uncharacterized protein n=1 Tax=Rhizophora mucronata TaxID=61149 RepID=A0A2P2PWW9_RHIMU
MSCLKFTPDPFYVVEDRVMVGLVLCNYQKEPTLGWSQCAF